MIVIRSFLAVLLTLGFAAQTQAHDPSVPRDSSLLAQYRAGLASYQKQDYATALREWRPIAEGGSSAAQLFVGFIYANGQGVAQDTATAAEWYRRAAEKDNMLAQLRLAMLYRQGQGMPQDPVEAYLWASLAARDRKHLGNVATALREALEEDMTPAQVSQAEQLERDWLAKHKKGD
jgi:TPR repeat protein